MTWWLAIILLVTTAGVVYGHGTGSETLPPVLIGDILATIQVDSAQEDDMVRIDMGMIRVEDQTRINDATYEITAMHGRTHLFSETFRQGDGRILFEFASGEPTPLTEIRQGGLFGILEEQRFRMTSPDLGGGGLYSFDIRVLTLNGRDVDTPPLFRSAISIPISYDIIIQDPDWGRQNMTLRTYYDEMSHISYDTSSRIASFAMPFEWDPEIIQEIEAVHVEMFVPQTYGDLLLSEFQATVNGIALPQDRIAIDDYFEDSRVIHIVLLQKNLMEIYRAIEETDIMEFVLEPAPQAPYSAVTGNAQFRILAHAYQDEQSMTTISFNVTDVYLRSIVVEEPYRMDVTQDGTVIHTQSGVSSIDTSTSAQFTVPAASQLITINYYELGGNTLASASMPIILRAQDQSVPSWVRTTAAWWVNGDIPDDAFIDAIAYLANHDIIRVQSGQPQQYTNTGIEDWIRTSIEWWAEGQTSDREFLQGITYLVEQGIIRLGTE